MDPIGVYIYYECSGESHLKQEELVGASPFALHKLFAQVVSNFSQVPQQQNTKAARSVESKSGPHPPTKARMNILLLFTISSMNLNVPNGTKFSYKSSNFGH
jgi:hypothetical protein